MDNAIHSNDITDGSSFDNFDSEAIIKESPKKQNKTPTTATLFFGC